jgi:CRISPR system Cascade subunit CasD
MSALAFYIDAPLQSWGGSSKFQYRETNNFPTKSAIVGLIAAAMGIDKHGDGEAEALAPLVELALTCVKRNKSTSVSTRLSDFHTVGGGYAPLNGHDNTSWEAMMCNHKASGGIKKTNGSPDTVVTHRSYLTDAAFVVILEGDTVLLDRIRNALLNPVWGVWFGRKTCLPATPLTPVLAADPQAALDALLDVIPGEEKVDLGHTEYQQEVSSAEAIPAGSFQQSDQPTAFGDHHGAVPAPYRSRTLLHHRPQNHIS